MSVAIIRDGETILVANSPRISASPMFPAPMNTIVLFCRLMSFSFSKNARANAYEGRTLLNGHFKVVGHPHRQLPHPEYIAKLSQPAEIGPRLLGFLSEWRDRHQSLHFQARHLVYFRNRGLQIPRLQAKLARFT